MFRVIFDPAQGQRVPVRLWARSTTPETIRQLQRLASQSYVVEFVAGMADAHVSEGVAVGSVFATERTVVPGALGGDLGCGMSAVRIAGDEEALDRRTLEGWVRALERAIPVGDATHRGRGVTVPDHLLSSSLSTRSLEHTREALAGRHLGTLGGGNHFLELGRDAEGGLWLLVHSGSRGLGGAVAAHHARVVEGNGSDALAGLDATMENGAAYLDDLSWALDFARANRRALATRALEVLHDFLPTALDPRDHVDIHHNFVAREVWFGRELLVHRKGAVAVPLGTKALVPGSMGTASYIVDGLGCEASFGSCSHGAGRVMSRKEARSRIRPDALAQAMRRVVYPEHLGRQLVEEAPAAYRDITKVLRDQEDLVERSVRLEPIAVLKG
jgi:tRNA-splicing ligase RtcB